MKQGSKGLAALLFAVCISVAGCGGEFAGVNRSVSDSAVSGGAVSGDAVSGSAVRNGEDGEAEDAQKDRSAAKTGEKKYRCSTDTNLYYEVYNDKNEYCIVQARLDGSHKEEVITVWEYDGELYLHYVDGNWLYYELELEDDEESVLYRVPIEKDSEGYDVVKTSEEEDLIREAGIYGCLWSPRDVIFDNTEDKIIRYDLQNKKILSEWNYTDFNLTEDDELEICRLKDDYAVLTEKGVYTIRATDTQVKKCHTSENCYWEDSCSSEGTSNCLFFVEDVTGKNAAAEKVRIMKCDGETVQTFITQEQMMQAARQAKHIKTADSMKECSFHDIYVQGDRIYIQLELAWKVEGVYHMEYVIFSQGETEKELRYEKELTECMQSHVKSREGQLETPFRDAAVPVQKRTILEKHVVANDAQCVMMLDGKVYLSLYDYEKDKGRMGCYELGTGKFHWVTKKEAKYGELGREGVYDEECLDFIFAPEDDNGGVGFDIGGGYFVETEE